MKSRLSKLFTPSKPLLFASNFIIEMTDQYFSQNKKLWNERVSVHLQSKFYDVEAFRKGANSLKEIEMAEIAGEVAGKSLLHLQCHFGQDSLALARLGAQVTGIDFSDKAIEAAQQLNDELGLNARFIQTNVYDLEQVLDGEFDVIFSTYGAIPWLPDLEKWAAIVSRFLKKGGIFYLAEFHPTLYLFNFDNYQVEYSYFTTAKPYEEKVQGTYADDNSGIEETEFFWNHATSEVVTPLLENGLELLHLHEFDFSPYACFPNMVEREAGRYVWGADKFGVRLPHVFSLKKRK